MKHKKLSITWRPVVAVLSVYLLTLAPVTAQSSNCDMGQRSAFEILYAISAEGPDHVYENYATEEFKEKMKRSTFNGDINGLHKSVGTPDTNMRQLTHTNNIPEQETSGSVCHFRFITPYEEVILEEDIYLEGSTDSWELTGLFFRVHNPH
ncbi:hypothetical protein [Phaeobacter sp. B1627]|uniref:hypothetical protein n=1 Tax=Phaeobacter sp. B1627 TaxID=2583809 RepID=UPI0011181DCB|nr:hypothetical protein [Phaeobacter sp. B1627]TNJ40805.1 hypothetical protein FGE21_16345 [Phaeobacter sp. B1627]